MFTLKKTLVTLVFLLITPLCFAQINDEEFPGILTDNEYVRHILIGAAGAYQSFYDESISPARYEGFGPVFSLGHIKQDNYIYTELILQGSVANHTRKGSDLLDSKVKVYNSGLDYRHLYNFNLFNNLKYYFHAGGIISANFMMKDAPQLENSAKLYEYALSLGICARVSRETFFNKKKGFVMWDISFPLLANFSRPVYNNRVEYLDPENSLIGDIFSNSKIGTFNRYYKISSRVFATYPLDNGNAIRFGYQWNYSRVQTFNRAFFAEHNVVLAFLFNH